MDEVCSKAVERDFQVREIAKLWNFSEEVVRNIFKSEPGVLTITRPATPRKRKYVSLRVPESIVERVHRRLSARVKLKRFSTMQLSKMQDLGGCRAVVKNVRKVAELVDFYEKNTSQALEFVKKFDYITGPKDDGYRSVHLVYKYQGNCQQ